jgi:hypothetical protein
MGGMICGRIDCHGLQTENAHASRECKTGLQVDFHYGARQIGPTPPRDGASVYEVSVVLRSGTKQGLASVISPKNR